MTAEDEYAGSESEALERSRSSDAEAARAFLRRLAGADEGAVIDRANAAVDDVDAAVAFVEDVGLDDLERAVQAADDPTRRARGERALGEFRRFRRAAAGEAPPEHFHPGHDTDLRDPVEGSKQ